MEWVNLKTGAYSDQESTADLTPRSESLCAICDKELPEKYTVLDRIKAVEGYTPENTRLIHQKCDVSLQESKGYA